MAHAKLQFDSVSIAWFGVEDTKVSGSEADASLDFVSSAADFFATLGNNLILGIRLMEEILHHLGCIKPCKSWDKLP